MKTARMTSGNILKVLLVFAVPMILGAMLQQFYYMADLIIAGYFLGDRAIAAAGANAGTVILLLNGVNGIAAGANILIAKIYGEGDEHLSEIHSLTGGFSSFMCLVSLIISLAGIVFMRQILHFMNVPDDIMADALLYSRIVFAGIPFQAMYSLFAAFLRGIGNSRDAMIGVIASAVTNIVLDIMLISFAGMGVGGLATASVAAQATACLYLFIRIMAAHDLLKFSIKDMMPGRDALLPGLKLGLPIGLQRMILPLGSLLSKYAIYSFGTAAVAGITTAYQIDTMIMLSVTNVGTAITTFAAQNRSAGKKIRAVSGFWCGAGISVIFSVFVSIMLFLYNRQMIGWFSVTEETAWYAARLLLTFCIFYPVFSLECAALGLLQGYEKVSIPVIGNTAALVIRVVTIYSLYRIIGFTAVPISEVAGWTTATIIYMTRCFKKDINVQSVIKQKRAW
ncbi:MAG: MATE family efflux transporter [Lachnospiraceae bacterium]|nr:MATE family efflux transporter [Lachnospiraceae bacterium]